MDVNNIAKIYLIAIKTGAKKLSDVPNKYRPAVELLMQKTGVVEAEDNSEE